MRFKFLGEVYGVEDDLDIVARGDLGYEAPLIAARKGNRELE